MKLFFTSCFTSLTTKTSNIEKSSFPRMKQFGSSWRRLLRIIRSTAFLLVSEQEKTECNWHLLLFRHRTLSKPVCLMGENFCCQWYCTLNFVAETATMQKFRMGQNDFQLCLTPCQLEQFTGRCKAFCTVWFPIRAGFKLIWPISSNRAPRQRGPHAAPTNHGKLTLSIEAACL